MNNHLSRGDVEAFARKTLAAADLLAASRHLSACPECAALLRAHTGSAGPLRLAGGDDEGHLTYEQIEAYVDGRLAEPDRAAMEEHARLCRSCAGDIGELQAFASRMTIQPAAQTVRPSWPARIRSWLRVPQFAMAASAAAVVAVLATSYLLVHHDTQPAGEVASVRPAAPPRSPDPLLQELQNLPAGHRGAIDLALRGEAPAGAPALSDDALDQARRDNPDSHLLLGALYQQRGMWAEAEREYRLLLDANPHSETARQLWQNARNHVR